MCDYSLHAIRNRLATDGERLVVHRFETGSIGLAPDRSETDAQAPRPVPGFWRKLFMIGAESDRPNCAVCIPPGASLVLHNVPMHIQRACGVQESEQVTFTQTSADEFAYRDAVRFRNGRTVLLQRLDPGQKVTVLSVSGAAAAELEPLVGNVAG